MSRIDWREKAGGFESGWTGWIRDVQDEKRGLGRGGYPGHPVVILDIRIRNGGRTVGAPPPVVALAAPAPAVGFSAVFRRPPPGRRFSSISRFRHVRNGRQFRDEREKPGRPIANPLSDPFPLPPFSTPVVPLKNPSRRAEIPQGRSRKARRSLVPVPRNAAAGYRGLDIPLSSSYQKQHSEKPEFGGFMKTIPRFFIPMMAAAFSCSPFPRRRGKGSPSAGNRSRPRSSTPKADTPSLCSKNSKKRPILFSKFEFLPTPGQRRN